MKQFVILPCVLFLFVVPGLGQKPEEAISKKELCGRIDAVVRTASNYIVGSRELGTLLNKLKRLAKTEDKKGLKELRHEFDVHCESVLKQTQLIQFVLWDKAIFDAMTRHGSRRGDWVVFHAGSFAPNTLVASSKVTLPIAFVYYCGQKPPKAVELALTWKDASGKIFATAVYGTKTIPLAPKATKRPISRGKMSARDYIVKYTPPTNAVIMVPATQKCPYFATKPGSVTVQITDLKEHR